MRKKLGGIERARRVAQLIREGTNTAQAVFRALPGQYSESYPAALKQIQRDMHRLARMGELFQWDVHLGIYREVGSDAPDNKNTSLSLSSPSP